MNTLAAPLSEAKVEALDEIREALSDLERLLDEPQLGHRLHLGDLLLVAAKARRLCLAIEMVRVRLGPGDGG